MTAGQSSSNCHVTVAARSIKVHQTRALLGFCVSVFLHVGKIVFNDRFPGRAAARPAVSGGVSL
ncbi:hypothetical protein EMIT0324P_30700 [Pseudomonas chlororaphis]